MLGLEDLKCESVRAVGAIVWLWVYIVMVHEVLLEGGDDGEGAVTEVAWEGERDVVDLYLVYYFTGTLYQEDSIPH
jgi:hypothetical protein